MEFGCGDDDVTDLFTNLVELLLIIYGCQCLLIRTDHKSPAATEEVLAFVLGEYNAKIFTIERGQLLLVLGECRQVAIYNLLLLRVVWVFLCEAKPESLAAKVSVEDCSPVSIEAFETQGRF